MRARGLAVLILLVAALLQPLFAAAPAAAGQDPAVLLLVDTSGSMADDDSHGTVKLTGAKSAIGAFLADVPDTTTVGMRTYPAGTGDCGGGKLVWKPQPLHRTRLGAEVRSLKADGGTPTAQALLAGAKDLEEAGEPRATIVLVSDGESNCDRDGPVCDVAKSLVDKGLAITVNTVGFQISEAGRTELECIAEATGGVYSDVTNSDQLADRLNAIARGILDLEVDAPTSVQLTVGTNGTEGRRITATVTNPGVSVARNARVTLQFLVPKTGDRTQSFASTRRPTKLLGNLQPGESREVEWDFRPPIDFGESTLRWRVLAGVLNGSATERTGTIAVSSKVTLDAAGPLLRDKKHVVILGDSYSAGEGAGSYESGYDTKNNACHRSTKTYATGLFSPPPVNLACSGAVTNDVVSSTESNKDSSDSRKALPSQAKQLATLRDRGTVPDLVLMTLGGNDINFGGIIASCVMPLDCTTSLRGRSGIEKDFEGAIASLPVSWNFALRMVNSVLNSDKAVEARHGAVAPIVVLGYPQIFPTAVGKAARCQGFLTTDEISFANRIGGELNSTLGLLAESLRRASTSVPVYFASDVGDAMRPDHTMCGAVPWANDLDLTRTIAGKAVEGEDVYVKVAASKGVPFTVQRFSAALALGAYAAEKFEGEELRTYRHAFHPTADGYLGMTAALVRWSNSADANTPVPKAPLDGVTQLPGQGEAVTVQGGDSGSLTMTPGDEHPLTVTGLPPQQEIRIVVRSAPVLLAVTASDNDGTARANLVVPKTLKPGDHRLEVYARGPDGYELVMSRALTIRPPRPWWLVPCAAASVLLLAWGGLLDRYRRRAARSRMFLR